MTTPRLSIQLYSIRDQLDDLDATMKRIAALGIDAVEPFSIFDRPLELGIALRAHGLSAPTGHTPFLSDKIEFGGRMVPLPPASIAFQAAAALGVEILFDPMVAPHRWRTPSDVASTAERLNVAAEEAAQLGLRVGYHNHSFEFHNFFDGVSAYEYFVSLLDERVALELDVFWAATAGQDVPALLGRLDTRVRALHLKDGVLAADPFAPAASYDPTALELCSFGQGELGLDRILGAATSSEFDVIEFDHFNGDVFEAIDQSATFMREVRGQAVTNLTHDIA